MDSCKPIFKKFRISPLACLYIKELCVFVQCHPQYFNRNADVSKRTARDKFKLCLPPCRLELYKRNVFVNAIRVYNKLPNDFKDLALPIFKRKLTQWLAEKNFYDLKEFMT